MSGHREEVLADMEPMIQTRAATLMAIFREYRSAMKDDTRAPTREPAGIAATIPP